MRAGLPALVSLCWLVACATGEGTTPRGGDAGRMAEDAASPVEEDASAETLAGGARADASAPADGGARDAATPPSDAGCPAGRTRCSGICVDTATDLANCGACGRSCDPASATPMCVGGTCFIASCASGSADCNMMASDGCETTCSASACTTSCGSTGTRDCSVLCAPSCMPPAEACNLVDDDCDGSCDESVAGCRVGVHRSVRTSGMPGHYYTTDRAAAAAAPYSVETFDYFRLYAAPAPGLTAFYRCRLVGGATFLTGSAACEGAAGAINEALLGYIASAATCGSTPLYRLYSASGGHFYTTSAPERDSAAAGGYIMEGVAGHVFGP